MGKRYYGLLFLGLAIAIIGWSDQLELRAEEPRRAIVSLEMAMEGHWLRPEIHDYPYYNKPPLYNWIQSLFIHLTGSAAEWVMRLPGLLSFLLLGWCSYLLGRRSWGKESAMFAAFCFLTSGHLLFYGTVNAGEIDLFLALVIFGQLACIYRGESENKMRLLFLGSYALAAVGALTKGLPAMAVQGFTLVAWLLFQRKWRLLFSAWHFAGISLFCAVVGGYLWAYAQGDDVAAFLVRQWKEAGQRTGFETAWTDTLKGTLEFPLAFFKLIVPWGLGLLFCVLPQVRRSLWANGLTRFIIIFLLANLPIYWITGDHKSRYLYFFLAPALMLSARCLYLAVQQEARGVRWLNGLLLVIMVLGALAGIAIPFLPLEIDEPLLNWAGPGIGLFLGWCAYRYWMVGFIQKSNHPKIQPSNHPIIDIYWWVFRWLIIARLLFNLVYFPLQQQRTDGRHYRAQVERLLHKADTIYWTGDPYIYASDFTLAGQTIKEVELKTAPLITYQIPYYLTRLQDEVMRYEEEPVAGRWYLSESVPAPKELNPREDLTRPPWMQPKEIFPADSIYDRWQGRVLYLWRW
ncbi:MAG: glycosyltransferase family 39 protein [Bacteroidota bacterium]